MNDLEWVILRHIVALHLSLSNLTGFLALHSTLTKTDTSVSGTMSPSKRDVRLIESQLKGVKKGRDQL